MDFCPNLDIIGDCFRKALQGSQFRYFRNIIIGIHEDYITSYNAPGMEFIEELKIKLENEKEVAHQPIRRLRQPRSVSGKVYLRN